MKVSMLNFGLLSKEERYYIVMSNIYDMARVVPQDSSKVDLITVLGCSPRPLYFRITKMMELVKLGYSKNILLSGGKGWQKLFRKKDENGNIVIDEEKKEEMLNIIFSVINNNILNKDLEKILEMPEARLMQLMILSRGGLKGVKIFHEPFSYNTKENIQYAKSLIEGLLKRKEIDKLEKMIIVTSSFHCKRAYLTFKKHFPDIEIFVCPATEDLSARGVSLGKGMLLDEYYSRQIDLECDAIINYSKNGSIADVELDTIVPKEVAERIERKHTT